MIEKTPEHIGQNIKICGWVRSRRDHGKIVFLDIKDATGIVQVVFDSSKASLADEVGEWSTVKIEGKVQKRPQKMINPKIPTGEIEITAEKLTIFGVAKPLPFSLQDDNGYQINEELRLKYRYIDLRRKRLQENLKFRAEFINLIRRFLIKQRFTEIETPILTKSTPEGARDFLVPSRLHPGKFYALPQSPQQYKQLLMVAGFERYFQFPRCFRDEDTRADRLLEFTQLDLEMAFVSKNDIMKLVEKLVTQVSEEIGRSIAQKPFPVLTFEEAMKRYNTDRPDLRKLKKDKSLHYVWITNFPMFEEKEDGSIGAVHHPFTRIQEKYLPFLDRKTPREKLLKIKAEQYDLVLNGVEIFGGSLREYRPEILEKVFEVLGHKPREIQEKFGHILKAFSYGVPPHGGIAAGLDRWLQTILGEKSIREVVAFPTSGRGTTSVMNSPSAISPKQLKELGIKISK